jgi:uncharacterized heparinase superfamily protein
MSDAIDKRAAKSKKQASSPHSSDTQHLVRGSDHGLSLSERMGRVLRDFAYQSGFYRFALKGRFPMRLHANLPDPWPGNAERGAQIKAGRLTLAGHKLDLRAPNYAHLHAPTPILAYFHSFAWIRDLDHAAGAKTASILEDYLRKWLASYRDFQPIAWRADVLGTRLLSWFGHAEAVLGSGDHVQRSSLLTAMVCFAKHLARTVERVEEGVPKIQAASGLVAAGLLLPGLEPRLPKAIAALDHALMLSMLPDGGFISRSPEDMLYVLQLLLTLKQAFETRSVAPTPTLLNSMDRLAPALLALTHPDGRLASFNGGGLGPDDGTALALSVAGSTPKAMHNAAHSGYQRLQGGRSVVILDAGPPPPGRNAKQAHAGTLAFEFSDGPIRLVVNCGGAAALTADTPAALKPSLRSTAAHSTLVLNDSLSTLIRGDNILGKGVSTVTLKRQESEEGCWVDAAHDGYAQRYGVLHRRRLFLRADGMDLKGEDILEPVHQAPRKTRLGTKTDARWPLDVRFHLAAGVTAIATQGQQSAALKLPNGKAWMFRCRGGRLEIAETLVLDANGTPRRTAQLVIHVPDAQLGQSINWLFERQAR